MQSGCLNSPSLGHWKAPEGGWVEDVLMVGGFVGGGIVVEVFTVMGLVVEVVSDCESNFKKNGIIEISQLTVSSYLKFQMH